ncbi:MAG TPA: LuxR C-terminal-related transcriptional regulator, partial [Actinomycetota bacterium]
GLAEVRRILSAESWTPFVAFPLIDLTEIAVEWGDAGAASEAAGALQEIAQRVDRDLYRALAAIGSAWSCLAGGNPRAAADRAADAVELLRPMGYRIVRGRALDLFGRSLSTVDREKALEAYREAVEVFEACQAVLRADQSREALRQLGSPGRRAVAASLGPASLTNREREVARLAAQGLTAREIGERLFISERTVTTHLTNVYAKLGVESKLDLVRRAPQLLL